MKNPKEQPITRLAAAIVNDYNQVLPYSTRSSKEQVEEWAANFYGAKEWSKLKSSGCRVASVEIRVLE